MKRILKAQAILENIIVYERPYHHAVAQYFKDHYIVKTERQEIRKLIVNALTNYLQYANFVTENIPNLCFDDTIFLILVLADLRGEKIVPRLIIEEEVLTRLGAKINGDLLNRFISKASSDESLISPYLDKYSLDYVSLRYSVPRFLVGMWIKHYGRVVALKILKSLKTQEQKNYRVNNKVLSREEILAKKDGIIPGVSETDIIVKDKRALINHDYLRIGGLLPIKEGVNHLVNKIEFHGHEEGLIADEQGTNFALALSLKSQNEGHIYACVPVDLSRLTLKSELQKYNLKNIEPFTSKVSSLITYLANPVDLVVYIPISSHFDAIRTNPDFFFKFKKEMFDELLLQQKDGLRAISDYVKEGGTLLYIVMTMNNKEGTLQVKDFLTEHPEFKLLEEKQLLPFEKRDTAMYYAILRKPVKKHD